MSLAVVAPPRSVPPSPLAVWRAPRPTEAELIAQVLDGPEPAVDVLRWAAGLAGLPFWQRRALTAEALTAEYGVPPPYARRLVALWALAARWFPDKRPGIACPRDAALLFAGLAGSHAETVMVLLLDGAHRPIDVEVVAVGSTNVAHLQPRDVFAPAMRRDASAVIVGHNHPRGVATPSHADRQMTMALREAAAVLGIPVLDHIVVARHSYHSFAVEEGWSDLPGWTADDRDSCY